LILKQLQAFEARQRVLDCAPEREGVQKVAGVGEPADTPEGGGGPWTAGRNSESLAPLRDALLLAQDQWFDTPHAEHYTPGTQVLLVLVLLAPVLLLVVVLLLLTDRTALRAPTAGGEGQRARPAGTQGSLPVNSLCNSCSLSGQQSLFWAAERGNLKRVLKVRAAAPLLRCWLLAAGC